MTSTKLTINEFAEKIVRDDVYCNVGQLVEFSIKKSLEGDCDAPVTYEETYQNEPDFDEWEDEEMIEWLVDNHLSSDEGLEDFDHDDLVQECQDYFTPDEPMEYWAISGWLAGKLEDENEIVIDGYPQIWGRCTSGQAIKMDGVIQKIAKDLYEL